MNHLQAWPCIARLGKWLKMRELGRMRVIGVHKCLTFKGLWMDIADAMQMGWKRDKKNFAS